LGAAAQLIVNARQIFVSKSNKQIRQDTVERLRRTKYRDPQSDVERRLAARAQELSTIITLTKVEQGWVKRDSTFASEYTIEPNDKIKVCIEIIDLCFSTEP
jgi:hypothetical protein